MAECPFCEYSGPSSSVEAHISGKSDEAHQGRVGRDWVGTVEASVSDREAGTDDQLLDPGMALLVGTVLFVAIMLLASHSGGGQGSPEGNDQEEDDGQEALMVDA